ncbi:hypothetical protein B0H17DRAFT_1112646 [Mycena rosella]|uniref:Uncharacterized protein n=1 Tax=Mycena rosella TaxID=1033263 RepID=A0AAD7FIG0_MYCRO|nr:hypothetical protein B0H17DRAFT_1112646 [Mycena rosella]
MPSFLALRDRCNVPNRIWDHRSKLAMTRSNRDDDASSYAYCAPAPKSRSKRSPPPLALAVAQATCTPNPRQFIPYLFLCPPRGTSVLPGGPWTHTLRLLPPSKTRPAGASILSARALDLHLPSAAFADERALHLSEAHLLLARDFLALALPYYASAHPDACFEFGSPWISSWPSSSASPTPITHEPLQGLTGAPHVLPPSQADPVRVLVIGPPRAALVISLTYLACASGCSVAQAMSGVREGDADAEWCRLLGKDGQMGLGRTEMTMLERVAMKEF